MIWLGLLTFGVIAYLIREEWRSYDDWHNHYGDG